MLSMAHTSQSNNDLRNNRSCCALPWSLDVRRKTWIRGIIKALPGWQQVLCRQVRDLVHAADPGVTETIKRTNRPYFTLNGNICALLGTKDHLTIFIYDPIVPDSEGIINQGQGSLTARAIQVHQGETFNQRALLNLFQAIIANGQAGRWRKLKGSQ